jgi:hypothetical protein
MFRVKMEKMNAQLNYCIGNYCYALGTRQRWFVVKKYQAKGRQKLYKSQRS